MTILLAALRTGLFIVLGLALLIGVLVGTGWTQTWRSDGMCQNRENGPWFPTRSDGVCYAVDEKAAPKPPLWIDMAGKIDTTDNVPLASWQSRWQAPCLDKMEAAMRAMEPYIAKSFVKKQDGQILYTVPSDTEVKGLLNAGEQWDATKRECWTNAP